jgi:hypothetical protein
MTLLIVLSLLGLFVGIPWLMVRTSRKRLRLRHLQLKDLEARERERRQNPYGVSGAAPAPAPGWYPDPRDPSLVRYFDGRVWTSSTQPGNVQPF